MRRVLLILFVLFAVHFKGTGQDNFAKTQKKYFDAVKNAKNDSTKMAGLIELGYNVYAGSKPDSAIYYYRKAYDIAVRIKNKTGLMKYYACYGDILAARSQKYEAINMARQAVSLAESTHNDHFKGAAYNNIAGCYSDAANIEKAYEYYLKAVSAYERLNDKRHLAAVYANILGIFFSVGHSPEKALEYGLKAIEVSRSVGDESVLVEALSNTATVYMNLGKPNKAITLLNEAMLISRRQKDYTYLINELVMYNNTLVTQRKYAQLGRNNSEIRELSRLTDNKRGMVNAEYFDGLAYFDAKNYEAAKQHFITALALARKYDEPLIEQQADNELADIELLGGNVSKYHDYNNQEDSIRTKLHLDQILINTQELETKYNVAKKEAAILTLHKEKQIQALTLQKRTIYIVILTCALCVLLIVGWLVRNNSIRKEKLLISEREVKEQQIQILEKEKELLTTQALMDGQEAERSRLAKDLHDGLGGILTGTKYSLSSMKQDMIISAENAAAFEKTMNMLDQSISELRRVAHNMMPESLLKLSLNDALDDYCMQITTSGALKVTYQSFGIDNLLVDEAVKIAVYRIVQELINNVVKHASAQTAIVQITRKEATLGITVEDDGKGFKLANLSFAAGMGYKNLKSRVDFLKGNIDVKSEPGSGTSVFIQLPV
ncbi:ATP-binding protein [Mucilaginibacter sp.]|uniref:tetratricopeptide repeat-containing sensor histidine kinase n=1 Tax=Mucilaginibacter sp. TaxID=1882438 RepID=UPI003D109DD2